MSQVLIQRPGLDGLSQAGPWYRSRRDGFISVRSRLPVLL